MKLFTKEIDKQLFAQYPKGSDLENQMVIAKIFNPYGRGIYYLLNSDPNDSDYLWAIVDLFEVEMGSVSRSELQTVKLPPFGLGFERDLYFSPKPAKEVWEGLMKGKRFAHGGYMAKGGKIVGYEVEYEKLVGGERERDIKSFKTKEEAEEFAKENYGYVENVYEGQYEYVKGGEMEEGVDLFEDYDDIPVNVQKILQKYDFEEGDYRTLKKAKEDVEKVGYTFEYSLDGTAYDLRKIGQKGKSEDEYAKGGEITPYIVWVSKDGEKRELFGEYKSKRAADMQMNKLWPKGEYKQMGNKPKSMYEKEGFYADGGMMAKGGEIYSSDNLYHLQVLKDGEEVDKNKFRARSLKEAKEISEDEYEGYYENKYGKNLTFIVSEAMAMGGKVKFEDKVKAVKESLLKRKKVSPKVQKDYGKTYSPKEAEESAKRIIGAQTAKYELKKNSKKAVKQ